jgi:hypothetical protein
MKRITVIGCILAISVVIFSQDREYQTLVDFDNVRISGLGGPFMQFTAVDGEFAHMLGGGGALLVGDFFFGGYGLGLTNRIQARTEYDYIPGDYLSVSHGGFWLGYSLFGDKAIHICISTLMGWGQVGIRRDYYEDVRYQDAIFTVSPTLEMELNLTRYFRIGAGASYNFYTMVSPEIHGYENSDFSAPAGFLSFKFGWF